MRAVTNVLTQYRSNPQQLPPRDVLEQQVLDSLIMLRLQVQRAQSTGIRVSDADVDQAMQRVAAEQPHLRAAAARLARAAGHGLSTTSARACATSCSCSACSSASCRASRR